MIKRIFYYISLSVAPLLFAGLFLINKLAYRRGGLNHHLIYRKNQYMKGIFSSNNLLLFSLILALFAVILIYSIFRKKSTGKQTARWLALFYILAFIASVQLKSIYQLLIYPYLLFSLLFAFCLALLAIMLEQ